MPHPFLNEGAFDDWMPGAWLAHERCQRPVGQGFFHTACVRIAGAKFHYVYDCGSENQDALRREIASYATSLKGKLDVLFVSHLDSDHVNGVDRLLGHVRAETVVLPYLSDGERIALIARAVDEGTANSNHARMVGDPIGWFADRNTTRIVFVEDRADPDRPNPETSEPPPIQYPNTPPQITLNVSGFREVTDQVSRNRGIRVYMGHDCNPLTLSIEHGQVNWCFFSFVHPEQQRARQFRSALGKRFGNDLPAAGRRAPRDHSQWLTRMLQEPQRRRDLAECYRAVWSNRNLTSLSLYSGPIGVSTVDPLRGFIHYNGSWRHIQRDGRRCAWIGTGDADLARAERRDAFLAHFSKVGNQVCTMSLPHHGSRHDFDVAIMFPSVKWMVAAAGTRNRHEHPHEEVKALIRDSGRTLVQASEEVGSSIVERISFG